jgi:hypothetical protein
LKEFNMNERERPRTENQSSPTPGPTNGPNGSTLSAMRQQASAMMQFSVGVLTNVLSGDSLSFNQDVHQPPAE